MSLSIGIAYLTIYVVIPALMLSAIVTWMRTQLCRRRGHGSAAAVQNITAGDGSVVIQSGGDLNVTGMTVVTGQGSVVVHSGGDYRQDRMDTAAALCDIDTMLAINYVREWDQLGEHWCPSCNTIVGGEDMRWTPNGRWLCRSCANAQPGDAVVGTGQCWHGRDLNSFCRECGPMPPTDGGPWKVERLLVNGGPGASCG